MGDQYHIRTQLRRRGCQQLRFGNPAYVAGTPSYVQKQINNDVTPDYHHRLGNSYSRSSQVALGSTWFFDRGYVGVSIDAKDSEYGVPVFSAC